MQVLHDDPGALRHACRSGAFDAPTAGHAPGRIQANLMIVPQADAFDFLLFCQRNPKPLPADRGAGAGRARGAAARPAPTSPPTSPGYRVYRDGELVEERADVAALWRPTSSAS